MLNEQQKKVVEFFRGQCVVEACPGSGKTTCITERVARLVDRGVPQQKILCLTFTNKAAGEMKSRICKRLGLEKPDFYIGTFHAFCVRILRQHADKIGHTRSFSIFDDNDQKTLYKHVLKEMGIVGKETKNINLRSIQHRVNKSREMNETRTQMADRFDDLDWQIAEKYLKLLKEQNAIDFSGLLFETIRLLEENDDVLSHIQDRYEFVQVDEIQDTNYAQFCLINLFSGYHKNIVLAGDLDQSIYKFRGARYQNVLDFINMYPDCDRIPLSKNYRSSPEIVGLSDKLIKHNSGRVDRKFETDNDSGNNPTIKSYNTSREEASNIAKQIRHYIDDEGWDLNDIAIFYRLNRLSLEVQSALSHNGIPFIVIGGPSFFDRMEIKDCMAILKWLVNPKDKVAFHRIIDLFAGIGETTYNNLIKIAAQNELTLIEACNKIDDITNRKTIRSAANKIQRVFSINTSGMHAGDALQLLMDNIGYDDHLKRISKSKSEYDDRSDNVDELINNATVFAEEYGQNIDAYLQNIALISSSDKESGDAVSLMTMHAAKGLEFPIVFMVGIERNIIPHAMAISEANNEDEEKKAIEEERRVCYVGMTRAKRRLHMSYCIERLTRRWGNSTTESTGPSRFINEIGMK